MEDVVTYTHYQDSILTGESHDHYQDSIVTGESHDHYQESIVIGESHDHIIDDSMFRLIELNEFILNEYEENIRICDHQNDELCELDVNSMDFNP